MDIYETNMVISWFVSLIAVIVIIIGINKIREKYGSKETKVLTAGEIVYIIAKIVFIFNLLITLGASV